MNNFNYIKKNNNNKINLPTPPLLSVELFLYDKTLANSIFSKIFNIKMQKYEAFIIYYTS